MIVPSEQKKSYQNRLRNERESPWFQFHENFAFIVHSAVWKNEKFSLNEKKIRQINYLATSLVKPLFSRNFCENSVR